MTNATIPIQFDTKTDVNVLKIFREGFMDFIFVLLWIAIWTIIIVNILNIGENDRNKMY